MSRHREPDEPEGFVPPPPLDPVDQAAIDRFLSLANDAMMANVYYDSHWGADLPEHVVAEEFPEELHRAIEALGMAARYGYFPLHALLRQLVFRTPEMAVYLDTLKPYAGFVPEPIHKPDDDIPF